MQTISDIQQGLDTNFTAFFKFIENEDNNIFTKTPNEKWSSGQHLEHLIRSTEPVLLALKLPKFLLGWSFGKANRSSRSFQDLILRYQKKLTLGGKASGRFVPHNLNLSQKNSKLETFSNLGSKLQKALSSWSDTDLDTYILPHPLLGKLTMREMLFFTIYHTNHHLKILQKRELLVV